MDVRFNVNEWVKVKLNDIGIQELQRQHNELDKAIKANGGKGFTEFSLSPDKDGYYKFQMHSLMQKFGHMMYLGGRVPFETDIILLNAKPTDK